MLERVILNVPSGWNPSVMVDDDLGRVVRIDLGGVIQWWQGDSEYVKGLRPCYAVYMKYDCNDGGHTCWGSNNFCECDKSRYPLRSPQYPNSPYLETNCNYRVTLNYDFTKAEGWEQRRSSGCFMGGGSANDDCGNKFSGGVGGEVVIEIPDEVLSGGCWFLVICFSEVVYAFTDVFGTSIEVVPPNEGCTVSYEFIKSDNTIGLSGSTDSSTYIYAYTNYSKLKLIPSPDPDSNYEFDKFLYKWGEGGNWSELSLTNSGEYILTLSTTSILFIKANFKPKNVEVSADFPIKQGMHLFGGWNLGYLEIVNSNVEFHFGVSSFSNLPIGSALVPVNGSRLQEILTPILVRQKYNLPKFGSIARLKNSNLIFHIPYPPKFKEVYGSGIYGGVNSNFERVVDPSGKLTDDSLISSNYGKHLMSIITFVVGDSSADISASRSVDFSGCSIKVVHNLPTSGTEWPHVSYFTLIRKFLRTADSLLSAFDYIILPCMFRDNVLTGFFSDDQPNSALFAAFTGFQFILNNSPNGVFFFDSGGTVNADSLEDNYFVPKNRSLNAFIDITST